MATGKVDTVTDINGFAEYGSSVNNEDIRQHIYNFCVPWASLHNVVS